MPSDRLLRFGLIGCGRVAYLRYLPILRSLPKAQLTAIADPDFEKLGVVRGRFPSVEFYLK